MDSTGLNSAERQQVAGMSMAQETTVVSSKPERTAQAARGEEYYEFLWSRIRQLVPQAMVLRWPVQVRSSRPADSHDLDVFVGNGLAPARAFLKAQGFHRVCKPAAYLERYRLRQREELKAYTVDLYTAERWGIGFRLADDGETPLGPRLACLLHAVVDGKGTPYFESKQNGPPWRTGISRKFVWGRVGRALWRTRSTGLLTLYLLVCGVISSDWPVMWRTLCRKLAFRIWQLTRKVGLEVALLGVDGTGKSSLANALLRLPAPVQVVYMGPHDFRTRIMRFASGHRVPSLFHQLAYRYDLLMRRCHGWFLARRGWIVVYDRHPAERLYPGQRSLRMRFKNLLDRIYAWPVDLTFWLTGDYATLYLRKKEYSAAYLQVIDRRYREVLEDCRLPYVKVDVTKNDLDGVFGIVSDQILAEHHRRISADSLPGFLKGILI